MSRKAPSGRKVDFTFMLRKYFVSAFVLFTFVAYAIHDRLTASDPASAVLPPKNDTSGTQLVLSSSGTKPINNHTAGLPTTIPPSPTALPIIPPATSAPSISLSAPTVLPIATDMSAATLIPTIAPVFPTATTVQPQVTSLRGANVRSGDSTVFDVVGGLQAGQTAAIIGISSRDNSWFLIQMPNGSQGWVSSTVVSLSGDLGSVPFVTPPPLPAPTAVPAVPTAMGQYADGQYTGDQADAFYGTVQVSVTIQNGQISTVQFLDYPHDRRTSQQINSIAMPYLIQEAIQVQSAYVNIVSGATLTSEAFAQSLYSALNKAKAGL